MEDGPISKNKFKIVEKQVIMIIKIECWSGLQFIGRPVVSNEHKMYELHCLNSIGRSKKANYNELNHSS